MKRKNKKFQRKSSNSLNKLSLFQKNDGKFSKKCPFSLKNAPILDYKNISLLKKYTSENGKIISSNITSVSFGKQKKLTREIKKAKILGLLSNGNELNPEIQPESNPALENVASGAAEAASTAAIAQPETVRRETARTAQPKIAPTAPATQNDHSIGIYLNAKCIVQCTSTLRKSPKALVADS